MKKLTLLAAALLATGAFAARPDTIGGSPKADFTANELTIPCVLVEGLDDAADGLFFDIRLLRRGKSFNYELVAAQSEDTAMCQAIADFAEMEDDDYVDEDEDDDEDDGDDGTDDDSETDDDSNDGTP